MEEAVRIDYDRVRKLVLVATESNLASFILDRVALTLDFVPNTEVPVGSGCTDLSISLLAYSCPKGHSTVPRKRHAGRCKRLNLLVGDACLLTACLLLLMLEQVTKLAAFYGQIAFIVRV